MNSQQAFTRVEAVQESQYGLPYHYIPTWEDGHFAQHLYWSWGFRYLGGLLLLLELLEEVPWKSCLDVGCGDGRLVRELARRHPGARLCGVDVSARAIDLARALNPGLAFECRDILKSPPPAGEPFEAATLLEVLEHIPVADAPAFVAAIARLQPPGGRLILTVPHVNVPLTPKHFQHFDAARLRAVVEPHYRVRKLIHFDNESPWVRRLLGRLLGNRFFVLSHQPLLDALFRFYRRRLLHCGEARCGRIALVAERLP